MKNSSIFKVISLAVIAVGCLLLCSSVKAETFRAGDYVSRIYVKKEKDSMKKYLRVQWINRSSDGKFVYCIDPWTDLDENQDYRVLYEENYHLSEEQLNQINLLAYYGYGYDNHQDVKWYAITQLLIWKVVDPEGDFYFTDRLNGKRVSLYESEMTELSSLVEQHSIIPSFATKTFTSSIKKDLTIYDENNQLKYFQINDPYEVVKEVIDNKVVLNSDKVQKVNLTISKSSNKYNEVPLIYINENSQDIYSMGDFYNLYTNFTVEFISGEINLIKKDSETKGLPDNKNLSLENAIYGVYNESNELVGKIITDKNGKGKINNLPIAKYYIKEIIASPGYEVDEKTYEITLDETSVNKTIVVYEKPKRVEFKIHKIYLDVNNQMQNEENITFGVYDKNTNKLIENIVTNSDGIASINLNYGEYIVKQLTTKDGYQKVEDFELTINSKTNDTIIKELVNLPLEKKVQIPDTGKNKMNIYFVGILAMLNGLVIRKKYEMVK